MIDFVMPSLGADMNEGTLREWRVKPGDKVKSGDIIAEVETQKGLIEIEVFNEGTIEKLLIEVGKKVPVGTVIAHIIPDEETGVVEKPAPVVDITKEKKIEIEKPSIVEKKFEPKKTDHIRASPLAKKIAEEKGIDISLIKGTGDENAITKEDVEKVISEKKIPSIVNEVKESSTPIENIRMAIATAMSRSNQEIPHYYLETKIDMSASLAMLVKENNTRSVSERLLIAVFLIKAVAKAIEEVPDINAWWVNGLQPKKDIHVAFVVSLRTGGIMVPAILDTGKKSLTELMKSLNDIIPRARALKLRGSEINEATITVTSLGDIGVETIYGIIYPPQVAIVGFGIIKEQAWVINNKVEVRPILSATLAADHRATDGIIGSKFLMALKKYLEKPELL